MEVSKFRSINVAVAFTAEDKARHESFGNMSRTNDGIRGRNEQDVVMIRTMAGKTLDIVTGIPPVFSAEARDRWAKARKEVEIENLFKNTK